MWWCAVANKNKGEYSFEADGKRYTLAVTMNAMADLEEHFNSKDQKERTFEELTKEVEKGRAIYIRAFLWALLQRDHPEVVLKATPGSNHVDVSTLIERAGGVEVVGRILQEVAKASEPDPADVTELGVEGATKATGKDPQRAGRGTSDSSTSTPGA